MDQEFISLFRVVVKKKFDAIIPVRRKGSAVLRRVKLLQAIPELDKIKVLDLDRVTQADVEGKRVVIFDDAIGSGSTVSRILERVKKLKPRYVGAATLVALATRSSTQLHAYAKHRVGSKMFKEWMKRRLRYYFQLGFPLDADHLVISYELGQTSKKSFIRILRNHVRDAGKIQDVSRTKDIEMATIEVNPQIIYGCLGQELPDFLHDFHASKIRVYVDGELLSVVPVANPVVLTSKMRSKCPESLPVCLLSDTCEKPPTSTSNNDRRLCLDCLITHSSLCLARFFCKKLQTGMRKSGTKLKLFDVTWNDMENKYKSATRLLDALKSDISS